MSIHTRFDRTRNNLDTANIRYFDAALRHQVGVRNFGSGEVRRIVQLLEQADQQLSAKLRRRLEAFKGRPANFSSPRISATRAFHREARRTALGTLSKDLKPNLRKFGKLEIAFEERMALSSLPIVVSFAAVSMQQFNSKVLDHPFSGGAAAVRTLEQWWKSVEQVDQARVLEALQMGMIQGETIDQMMRRVAGTKSRGFTDGVLALTRRNAETVVRTAVNHVSNAARELFWEENKKLIPFLRWTSTLDGGTSTICKVRDGKVTALGDGPIPAGTEKLQPPTARPPALPNCRSLMVGIFSVDGVLESAGDRPFVRGRLSKIDFRQRAKDTVGKERWKDLTPKQRTAAVRTNKRMWGQENIGQVPSNVNYQQWLTRQPAGFQNEVLGKTKGKLFRDGKLPLDRLVDKRGNELNLKQLAAQDPMAFEKAGLDPNTF